MSEKSNPSFQKARDEALRALVLRGGLAPDQVSALKLNQVHLATGTLVIEPDEFASSSALEERRVSLKLDATMQRALIAWLVARPDGPNDHLFPGAGLAGLDVATINQVIAAKKPVESPEAADSVGTTTPYRTQDKKGVEPPPEAAQPGPRSRKVQDEPPSPPPPSVARGAEPQAVPLDEIESLRKRLAEVYDDWAPVAPSLRTEPKVPPEPVVPPPESDQFEPARAPASRPEKTVVTKSPLTPPGEARVATPAAPPLGGLGDKLKGLWKWSENKVILNLPYRGVAIGSLVLVVFCCIGLAFAGGAMLRGGGTAGLLAGATPSEIQATTEEASLVAAFTPEPTASATPKPTPTPSATPTASPAPTDTPAPTPTLGPTPTPIIIVVTATPTPEPSPSPTSVPTNTPVGGVPSEPTATPTAAFKYPAPVLLEPEDGSVVPGVLALLRWEPVGPLADDERYAVRFVFRERGELVYEGDWVKISEWWVPERLYYRADGPALEYRWYVFVERENPDGSATPLSPESETFVFRWE